MKTKLLIFCITFGVIVLSSFSGPRVDDNKKVRVDEVIYKPKTPNVSEAMWVFKTKLGIIISSSEKYKVGDSINVTINNERIF